MSEQNLQKPTGESVPNESEAFEELVLRINKATNEIVFRNPVTGKTTAIRPQIIEEEEEPTAVAPPEPLTPEEFYRIWQRLESQKISWSTDIPPAPILPRDKGPEFWKEFIEIQNQYPSFPRELGQVILKALLGRKVTEEVKQKAATVQSLLTQEYRSEFFFKYAIKVPYFEEIDWEVVVKAYERGTTIMPKIAYALLSIALRNPVDTTLSVEEGANAYREPQFITVAVNEQLVDRLTTRLIEIKRALERAQRAADSLIEKAVTKTTEEEQANGTNVIT